MEKLIIKNSVSSKMILDNFFVPSNKIETSSPFPSPSGKYNLLIETYTTSPNGWDYSRGKIMEGDSLLFEINRKYPDFWFSWDIHLNGNEYLLCGQDPQSLTIINVTQKSLKDYPLEWYIMEAYPQGKRLALVGCDWGCSLELRIYSFPDPENFNPEDILRRDDNCLLWWKTEIAWIGENTLKVTWIKDDGVDDDFQSFIKRVKEYDPHIPIKIINEGKIEISY